MKRWVFPPLLFLFKLFMQGAVMGQFITFEGIEGCGKTTQIKRAGEYLTQRGIPFIITEEPGGTPIGRTIREILLNKGSLGEINSETELLLFSAARSQHVRDVIIPALKACRLVLCDRFYDATLAYQGYGRGLDIDFIRAMNAFSSANVKPALTFLLDLPVEIGLKRAMNRISRIKDGRAEDRFEREDMEFHKRVRTAYLSLAEQDKNRFRIINGTQDIETVHQEICSHLSLFMNNKL
jgi:dTMP kinase